MKRTRTYYQCNICDQTSDDVDFIFEDEISKAIAKENIHVCDDCWEYTVIEFEALSGDIKSQIRKENPKLDILLKVQKIDPNFVYVAIIPPSPLNNSLKMKYMLLNKLK
jgi:hypothetical protein